MKKFSKDPDAISRLSPEQYRVTQQNGTETPGTGEYLDNKEPGIYVDIVWVSRCSHPPTSLNRAPAGLALPSRSNLKMVNELRHRARHDSHRGSLGAC